MKKISVALSLLALVALSACSMAGSRAEPTPTIVRLNLTPTSQALTSADERPATATPIPLPSPTPTLTPMIIAQAETETSPAIADQFESATAIAPTPVPQVEVVATWLNIRQGPGLDYPVIGTAGGGDRFEILGMDESGHWLQVITGHNETGWISGQESYTRRLGADGEPMPVVKAAAPAPASAKNKSSSGRLIFMTGSGGDLYAVNTDGSDLRRLTGGVIDPVVSPDGRQVAFTRWDGAEFGTLYVMNLDGAGERAVKSDLRQPKSPTWSPDGRQIVISYQHGGLRDPDNRCTYYSPGNFPRLSNRVTIHSFKVSSDGSINVCFTPFEDLHWKLAKIDVATGAFEDLPSERYSYNPAWDSQNPWRVVYDGEWGLVQLDVTNGNHWPLTEDLRDTGPVFSPDGRMLALTYKQHDHWEVYTLDLTTGARQRLTKPPILAEPQYNSASPAWSPDGTQITFVTDRSGTWEIWVMNADGSNPRPLFPPEMQAELKLHYHGVNERMLNWVAK